MGNRIDFSKAILKYEKKDDQKMYYSLVKYKKKGYYDILKDISEYVTLGQLLNSLGNLNRAISVVGNWIFDSNYEKALVLNKASLDIICTPSVGE